MKLALLVTDLLAGGTPLRLARLARGLARRGHTVSLIALGAVDPSVARVSGEHVEVASCRAHGASDIFAVGRLARLLRRIRPDLLHATLFHANVAARLVAFPLRLPLVTSTATVELSQRWHVVWERYTRGADYGHVVNSQTLATHAIRAFGRRQERVFITPPLLQPPPARLDRATARQHWNLHDNDVVVLWHGRLDPVKRVDMLIAALAQPAASGLHLLICGDGPERPRLQQQIQELRLQSRVQLTGWQNDLSLAMSAADIFAFPSLTEGLPNAVLEAMAFGLPVVASDIAALRELAGPLDERAVLCNGADPAELAFAMVSLASDPARRSMLADAARAYATALLDSEAVIRAHEEIYQRILREARRSAT